MAIFSAIKRYIAVAFAAAFSIITVGLYRRASRAERENEELTREVKTLHIEAEAEEYRSRPVVRDKSDILGRM